MMRGSEKYMIPFLFVLSSLFAYTCFKGLQIAPTHPYIMFAGTSVFFALMISSMFISRNKPDAFEAKWFMVLTWIGSLFMGWWGTFIMISIPIDIVHFVFSMFKDGEFFIGPRGYTIILALSALVTFLGFVEVLRGPKVVEVDLPIKDLPPELENLKIAQISDLHIGPTIQSRYVNKVVKKTNATHADLVVITGDLADAHTDPIKKHLCPLGELQSRFGTFYVTGNHEYYWGVESLLPELKKLGFELLINSNRILNIGSAKLLVAGISDPVGRSFSEEHRPDLIKARETQEKTDFNILLAHRPDPYVNAEKYGFQLQFSGHTHAGQFFPFSLLIPIAHRYYKGLNRHGKLWLYVNPGTGYWGPAHRFGIASEITLLKLSKV